MARRRFKDRSMQEVYEACRRLAADPLSEFYYQGKPRSGAGHRNAYWNGRRGAPPKLFPRGSLSYACWRAGADDYLASGKTVPELPQFHSAQTRLT